MYGVRFRDELDEPVARELDALSAKLRAVMLAEHNEDGTHNFSPSGSGESSGSTPGGSINATVQLIIDHAQDRGQWWKRGPYILDDPLAAQKHSVLLRPTDPAAGTYHNYEPPGIDTAAGMELLPLGNVIITGMKALDSKLNKRFFYFRNRSFGPTVTFKHTNAGSLAPYQFDLAGDVDLVVIPKQGLWFFYDIDREAWTS